MVNLNKRDNILKLKYQHYDEYIDGWFEGIDLQKRKQMVWKDPKILLEDTEIYINYDKYKSEKRDEWNKFIEQKERNKKKRQKNYLNALTQMVKYIKSMPTEFTNIYPPPCCLGAYQVKGIDESHFKQLLDGFTKISTFKLIKRDSAQFNQIKEWLYIPFTEHLTMEQMNELKTGQKIEYRQENGRYFAVTIIEKNNINLKIRFLANVEICSDFNNELYRFANYIKNRPCFRYCEPLKKGDIVYINPIHKHPGWKKGVVTRMERTCFSAQIEVVYEWNGDTNCKYWVHPDNVKEFSITDPTKKRKIIDDNDSAEDVEPFRKKRKLDDAKNNNASMPMINNQNVSINFDSNPYLNINEDNNTKIKNKSENNDDAELLNVDIVCSCCQIKIEPDNVYRCSACKKVFYCDTECQRKHWKIHQTDCVVMESQRDIKSVNEWKYYGVIYWLNRVDHGRFSDNKYDTLRKHIRIGKISGNELCDINHIVLKMMDIQQLEDRKMILNHIQSLLQNNNFNNLLANTLTCDEIPDCYCDPMSYELMDDPVIVTISGYTFERKYIEKYIKEYNKDPMTQKRIELTDIVPNKALKDAITGWIKKNSIS